MALKTNGGAFELKPYNLFDSKPGQDTNKICGIDIDITFTPAKTVRSDQISFVQIMRCDKGGSPLLFPNEKPRATEKKDGEEGWAVDRVSNQKNADYQIGNDGKEVPDWGQVGHRKPGATSTMNWVLGKLGVDTDDVRDAVLKDQVRLPRDKGQTFKCTATSFALDKTNSRYLGGVAWGYEVDAAGQSTKTTETVQSMGDPSGVQKHALEKWNEQAENPDVSKRNDPDQQKITVP